MSSAGLSTSKLPLIARLKQCIDEDRAEAILPQVEREVVKTLQEAVEYAHAEYKPVYDRWQDVHIELRQLHARVWGRKYRKREVDDRVYDRVSHVRERSASRDELVEEIRRIVVARRKCHQDIRKASKRITVLENVLEERELMAASGEGETMQ